MSPAVAPAAALPYPCSAPAFDPASPVLPCRCRCLARASVLFPVPSSAPGPALVSAPAPAPRPSLAWPACHAMPCRALTFRGQNARASAKQFSLGGQLGMSMRLQLLNALSCGNVRKLRGEARVLSTTGGSRGGQPGQSQPMAGPKAILAAPFKADIVLKS